MKYGILILAGGKSSRMQGKNKAMLQIQEETFLSHICKQFESFEHVYLSTNKKEPYVAIDCKKVYDEYDEIGPMAGIVSAFHQSDIDAFFTIACDMPWIQKELAYELFVKLSDYDGVFVEDNVHVHALGGIYTRAMLPRMEMQIAQGDYALMHCIQESNSLRLHMDDISCTSNVFENVNTMQDYQRLFEN